MFQPQLINAVVAWEWQLKMEEEKRKNLQGEPAKTFAPTSEPRPQKRSSIFQQISKRSKTRQPVYGSCAHDQCQEAQLG